MQYSLFLYKPLKMRFSIMFLLLDFTTILFLIPIHIRKIVKIALNYIQCRCTTQRAPSHNITLN